MVNTGKREVVEMERKAWASDEVLRSGRVRFLDVLISGQHGGIPRGKTTMHQRLQQWQWRPSLSAWRGGKAENRKKVCPVILTPETSGKEGKKDAAAPSLEKSGGGRWAVGGRQALSRALSRYHRVNREMRVSEPVGGSASQ